MPATIGMYLIETGDEVELLAQVAKGEGGQLRPGRPGQAQGINPGPEGVAWKSPQETFFGAVPVGHHHPVRKEAPNFRPEGEKRGGAGKVLVADAVYPPGRPGDFLVRGEEGAEGLAQSFARRPEGNPNLDRDVGAPPAGSGGLKVDDGKLLVGNQGNWSHARGFQMSA